MAERKVYTNPKEDQPLLSSISSGCKTPILEVKYCNMIRPFYYPNSPGIARYSITCVLNPTDHEDFIRDIRSIEKNEKVESIIKEDYVQEDSKKILSGNYAIKFQTKNRITVYIKEKGKDAELLTLEDEIDRGEKIIVVYDILRYTKKNTVKVEHGLSFRPSSVYFLPDGEA